MEILILRYFVTNVLSKDHVGTEKVINELFEKYQKFVYDNMVRYNEKGHGAPNNFKITVNKVDPNTAEETLKFTWEYNPITKMFETK